MAVGSIHEERRVRKVCFSSMRGNEGGVFRKRGWEGTFLLSVGARKGSGGK